MVGETSTCQLQTNASGGGGNPAAGPTGSAVPSNASYEGFNSGGNLVGASAANPLPVTIISGSATNASVGATGAAVPGSITYMGLNNGGNAIGMKGDSSGDIFANIVGTLPAFASTPAFTISGTLPAYAATPTFNCGTGCGNTTPPAPISPTVSLAATSATSQTALTTSGSPTQVNVCNAGPNLAFFNLGTSSAVTATTTSQPLGVGACFPAAIGANTNIAAITAVAGQTATVYATSTTGSLSTGYNGAGTGNPLYVFTSTGYVQVTGITTSTGFTPPAGSVVCYIEAEGAQARYRTDGTAPTASVGQLLNQYSSTGAFLTLTANLSGIRFIPVTGTLTIDADCYK